MDKSLIPCPVFESNPELVEFYWLAWQQAWDHIKYRDEFPQSPYMDEGCLSAPDTIWIWDTAFMAMFCRYSFKQFPGIESLNNFYYVMHDDAEFEMSIHHPDNPPLFAYAEYLYAQCTGDLERLKWVLCEKEYLQKHYKLIENINRDLDYEFPHRPIKAQKEEFGFMWSGDQSGMDNTPRGRDNYDSIYWLDLLAQQALSAKYISKIAKLLGEDEIVAEYELEYNDKIDLLNKYYWNEEDGCYYDVFVDDLKHCKIKTIAMFWPMLAQGCSDEQASKMMELVKDPDVFGGKNPFSSVARDDEDFVDNGCYWRGGIWLPTAYMTTKALEAYGYKEQADEAASNLLSLMHRTYKNFEPNTIWETYSPTEDKPALNKVNKFVRADFCGWSALGPISMFIENILGFREINAFEKTITWDIKHQCRHGIERLNMGDITTDILTDGKGVVSVKSNAEYTLEINGTLYKIEPGNNEIKIDTA